MRAIQPHHRRVVGDIGDEHNIPHPNLQSRKRLAVDEGGIRVIQGAMTQQEIADRAGATREMVNQVLRDQGRGGFVDLDEQRRIVLIKELPKRR